MDAPLKVLPTLKRLGAALADPGTQRAVLARAGTAGFEERAGGPLLAQGVEVLQVNVGRVCNQTCRHCHVDAGPDREESMPLAVAEACLAALAAGGIPTLDVTGGAPELWPHFRFLVAGARALGRRVIDRCNLTVLETAPHAGLAEFLAEQGVEVVASLPHYRRLSTDAQRGEGVFDRSIRALQRLNALGYGRPGSGLRLVLVTNPQGVLLPASQAALEAEWKAALARDHGIAFDALYTLANMPISRFLEWLEREGRTEAYLKRLVDAFNPATVAGVMCRTTVSVGWDGRLFDCDFNQMLDLDLLRTIFEWDGAALARRRIRTGPHCFGCTAGAGSSCGGAVT